MPQDILISQEMDTYLVRETDTHDNSRAMTLTYAESRTEA